MALAEALHTVSHDRLTSMLHADWSGQRLLESAWRTLFVWERGYRILDDTVVPTPVATAMEGLAWVFSSRERKPVYGFSLVLLTTGSQPRRAGFSRAGVIPFLLAFRRTKGRPDAHSLLATEESENPCPDISVYPCSPA